MAICILFTIEYLTDLNKSINCFEFIKSKKSIIDLLTIIPLFIELVIEIKHWTLVILKVLISLRIVRFFN